jgi:hypothetical protein
MKRALAEIDVYFECELQFIVKSDSKKSVHRFSH